MLRRSPSLPTLNPRPAQRGLEKLPPEVMTHIFVFLGSGYRSKRRLIDVALVGRAWHSLAIAELHREVAFGRFRDWWDKDSPIEKWWKVGGAKNVRRLAMDVGHGVLLRELSTEVCCLRSLTLMGAGLKTLLLFNSEHFEDPPAFSNGIELPFKLEEFGISVRHRSFGYHGPSCQCVSSTFSPGIPSSSLLKKISASSSDTIRRFHLICTGWDGETAASHSLILQTQVAPFHTATLPSVTHLYLASHLPSILDSSLSQLKSLQTLSFSKRHEDTSGTTHILSALPQPATIQNLVLDIQGSIKSFTDILQISSLENLARVGLPLLRRADLSAVKGKGTRHFVEKCDERGLSVLMRGE
ncbi:hypothetical protein P7C70_g3199, partial [Phenoliferia sp. Uapishka_3]